MDALVRFGPQDRLHGVLCGPPTTTAAPTLVLPSAGLLPRAGPFRLHVELAQRLAARGLRTFRFDVPGVGESPRFDGFGSREATVAALDKLQAEHGCSEFVVGGLCSAADLAWHVAIGDRRVSSLLMLDGVSFTGPWFHLALVASLLRRPPREWPGIVQRLLVERVAKGNGQPSLDDYRDWPSRVTARAQFATLIARDVRSLWIYTGGHAQRFRHPRQFRWSFGVPAQDPRVALHYWPECDHTFYARAHRNRLLDTVEAWLLPESRPQQVGA